MVSQRAMGYIHSSATVSGGFSGSLLPIRETLVDASNDGLRIDETRESPLHLHERMVELKKSNR